MRRATATALLAAIGYLLIAPAAFAGPESNLPACCRRAGAHHCAMAGGDMAPGSGAAVQPVPQKCPLFPAALTAPGSAPIAIPKDPGGIAVALVSSPCAQPRTEARGSVSFSRSRQKRGPPSPLS